MKNDATHYLRCYGYQNDRILDFSHKKRTPSNFLERVHFKIFDYTKSVGGDKMSNDFNYKLEELHNLPCRISELRISKGLSKKQLATALGVSASTISSYECETRLPSLDMLVKLCYYFKVSSDYILGIEKPKNYSTCNTDGLTLNQMKAIEAIIIAFKSE